MYGVKYIELVSLAPFIRPCSEVDKRITQAELGWPDQFTGVDSGRWGTPADARGRLGRLLNTPTGMRTGADVVVRALDQKRSRAADDVSLLFRSVGARAISMFV